jgi:hypothetical protein
MEIQIPLLALLISCITAIIFAITLAITWKATKQNTRATYAQLLRGFHEDLTQRLNKNAVLHTTEDCERYANDYLNTLDEIAFLAINNKIPLDIAEYFHRFFSYGQRIIDWYDNMIGEDFKKIARENWPNYFVFCQKFDIRVRSDDKLPRIMLDYNKLQSNER